jgi:beta-xylosidase
VKIVEYKNPLWPGYFADPFVLQTNQGFYAYGTGAQALESDGRAFPLLHSRDLAKWEYLGGALKAQLGYRAYWAPEVAYAGGKYFLYYSANARLSDEGHHLRVAVADRPEGPFLDSGEELMPGFGFSIDANPFFDPVTGEWYLFFATDYLVDEPFGTGIAVVKLKHMTQVEGRPIKVNRATQQWQLYEANRNHMGKIWKEWYCVEGPCTVFRAGKYWCLYSGGRWSGDRYGVGFAVADHPLGPWRDDFAIHGATVLGGTAQAAGPGHTSIARIGNQTDMLVYHCWDAARTARRMCLDPLIWTPQGPRCDGPSVERRTLNV